MIARFGTPTVANAGASGTLTSLACNVPTGAAPGMLMLALAGTNFGTTTTMSATGWTTVPGFTITSLANNTLQYLFYRLATASEPASYTFNATSAGKIVVNMSLYTGVNLASPFAGVQTTGNATASTTIVFPSVTATAPLTYAILTGITRNATGAPTIGASSGFSVAANTSTTASAFIQAFMQDGAIFGPPAGTVAPGTATNSQSTNYSTGLVLLQPNTSSFFSMM